VSQHGERDEILRKPKRDRFLVALHGEYHLTGEVGELMRGLWLTGPVLFMRRTLRPSEARRREQHAPSFDF
jgi:hypothetical protein